MTTATKTRKSRQVCTECGEPSISGLVRGKGKCQYHWNAGVWGKEWADKCRTESPATTEPAANPHEYGRGTRLSNAYTIGRDGLPRPKWCGDSTSAASKAWQKGFEEFAKHDYRTAEAVKQVLGDTPTTEPLGGEATPRPWIVDEVSDGVCYVVAKDIAFIATLDPSEDDTPARANADLIVTAVNAYDRDQRVIRELQEALEAARDWFDKPTEYANTKQFKAHADSLRKQIRAALATAGEGGAK